jgi:hypothetical protein
VQWSRKRIHGRDYDLSHLDPFMLQVLSLRLVSREEVAKVEAHTLLLTRPDWPGDQV